MIVTVDTSNMHMLVVIHPEEIKDLMKGSTKSLKWTRDNGWEIEVMVPQIDPRTAMFRQGEGGRFDGHTAPAVITR